MSKLLFFQFHTEREGWQWLWLFSEKYFCEIFSENDFHLDLYGTSMVLFYYFSYFWSLTTLGPIHFHLMEKKSSVTYFKTLPFEFDRKTQYHMGLEQHEGK